DQGATDQPQPATSDLPSLGLAPDSTADDGQDEQRRGGGQRGQRGGQRGEQPAPQGEVVVPADLGELLAKTDHEMRIVASRYTADHGSLSRTYALAASPTRYARL